VEFVNANYSFGFFKSRGWEKALKKKRKKKEEQSSNFFVGLSERSSDQLSSSPLRLAQAKCQNA